MRKLVILLVFPLFYGCKHKDSMYDSFTESDRVYIDKSVMDRITVYGNIHADPDHDIKTPDIVRITQLWLFTTVKENVVVVEGLPGVDRITKEYLVRYLQEDSPWMTDDQVLYIINRMSDQYVNYISMFAMHSDKVMFGGENDSLYNAAVLTDKRCDPQNVNARSRAIFLNAVKIAKRYPYEHIAVIIGRAHLAWFKWNNIQTVDPVVAN